MDVLRISGGMMPSAAGLDVELATRRRTRAAELQLQVEQLTQTMRIAVIFGGNKDHPGAVINPTFNPRHWKSYEAVAEDIAASLRRIGFRFVSTIPDDMKLGDRLRQEQSHFAWLNTGGVQGLGSVSHASAMLEMFGIPYVGHNPLNAATMDNKSTMKRDLIVAGIPTAPFMVWQPSRGPLTTDGNPRLANAFGEYGGPFVVKPISGRASRHVVTADDIAGLAAAVEYVYAATDNPVLIESYLSGREFCVAVCGEVVAKHGKLERLGHPFAFAAVERMLDEDERIFTSMDHRPITQQRLRRLDSQLESDLHRRLVALANHVYTEFDIETLIRLDVRSDDNDNLYVLEANPKPDLALPVADRTSIVCASLADEGMTYDDLILSLIADRIDVLFSERRATVSHLKDLLG